MDHYRDMVAEMRRTGYGLPELAGPPVTGQRVVREPRGVVAAITPWNAPRLLNLWKVAPALVTGNPMVLKPAPGHAGCALCSVNWRPRPAVTRGVLTSSLAGADVGQAWWPTPRRHGGVHRGQSAVGRAIAPTASATIKRTLLELGGKSALLALPDAKCHLWWPPCCGS